MRLAIVALTWLLPQVLAKTIPKNYTVEEDIGNPAVLAYNGGGWADRYSPHNHGSKHVRKTSTAPDASATFTFTGWNVRYCYVFMVNLISAPFKASA